MSINIRSSVRVCVIVQFSAILVVGTPDFKLIRKRFFAKMRLPPGLCPGPCWGGAYSAPRPPAGKGWVTHQSVCVPPTFVSGSTPLVVGAELSCFCYGGTANSEAQEGAEPLFNVWSSEYERNRTQLPNRLRVLPGEQIGAHYYVVAGSCR